VTAATVPVGRVPIYDSPPDVLYGAATLMAAADIIDGGTGVSWQRRRRLGILDGR